MSNPLELEPAWELPTPPAASPNAHPVSLPSELWPEDLSTLNQGQTPWLWHGYLAPGNVTLLTSQWKSGKTTLVAVLLSRLKTGGSLAGLTVAPGKAVVVTEESPAHWQARARKLDFGRHVCWLCRPFRGKPRSDEWLALIDRLARLHDEHGITLVVIDPLASFLPGRGESDAACMLDVLMPLQRLTTLGMAVLVLHHPRKGETVAGQAARGSGALSGYVDIIVEMECYSRLADEDRRRKLRAFSRHEETPRQMVIELTPDGTDYLALGDFASEEFHQTWQALRDILELAPHPLTRHQLLDCWAEDATPPDKATVWKWLDRALDRGLICRAGTGHKNDPFIYWLPAQMEKWRADPIANLYLSQIEALRQIQRIP